MSSQALNVNFQTLTRVQDTRPSTLKDDLLALFKQHARITHNFDDALIGLYLGAAISRWEQYTEVPVAPAAYEWALTGAPVASSYEVPLYNCTLPGEQFGFELLCSKKIIDAPASWPVKLEVGFLDIASMPEDIVLGLFEIALFLYEQRSTIEMLNGMLPEIINPIIQRYWVPRC